MPETDGNTMNRRRFLASIMGAGVTAPLMSIDEVSARQNAPAPPSNVRLEFRAPTATTNRKLLGGWRVTEEFAQGVIAIDFIQMKLWMVGHVQRQELLEYDLPPMGIGPDADAYPRVNSVKRSAPFWQDGYANGLILWRGKLWASPRKFYDTTPPPTLSLFAQDGERLTLNLPRQVFSGFVKRGPGLDPLIGCGGYESGQGSSSGPSLATLEGRSLLQYSWPADPGPVGSNGVPASWNDRAPREPNYSCSSDSWVAWKPRIINGMLQGRWASDCIYGGGLMLPEGITYWAYQGTGDLEYGRQRPTFAAQGLERTYEYRYDPSKYKLSGYFARPDLGSGPVLGQELGPDGKVYLAHGSQWTSGGFQADVALRVYG
jgi:hypothetical protein